MSSQDSTTVKNGPLISVVVPVCNVEDYVDRCLDSICGQIYDALDIVVVDDGSTDASGEICDSWAARDGRVTVVHTPNRGLAAARNEGMRHVRGDYVLFVDSDDYVGLRHVENLYSAIRNADAKMAVTGMSKASAWEDRRFGLSALPSRFEELNPLSCLSGMITREGYVDFVVMGKLYSRDLFPLLSFPEGRLYEDIVLSCKIMDSVPTVVYEDAHDYYYTTDRAESITKNAEGLVEYIREIEELRRYVTTHISELVSAVDARYYSSLINACITLAFAAPESQGFGDLLTRVRKERGLALQSQVPFATKAKYVAASLNAPLFCTIARHIVERHRKSDFGRMPM